MITNQIESNSVAKTVQELLGQDFIKFEKDLEKERHFIRNQFFASHNGGFWCIAVSDNGQMAVTGSFDTTVRLWDLNEKKQIACYSEHKTVVRTVAISKDCRLVLSGSDDKTVVLWDARSQCLKNVFYGDLGGIFSAVFSEDEKFIISGSSVKEIFVWRMSDYGLVGKIIAIGGVQSVLAVSSSEFASATYSYLEKWDLTRLQKTNSVKAHESAIWSLVKTKNNQLLITGSQDRLIKIWEAVSFKLIGVLNGHTSQVLSVCVTEDDSYIVSGSDDKTVILWSIQSKSLINRFNYHSDIITGVASKSDSIFTVSRDSRIGIIKLSNQKFESFISLTPFFVGSESYKEDSIAVGSLNTVLVWHTSQPEIKLEGHKGIIIASCFCKEKDLLISGCAGIENNLILWDLNQKSILAVLYGHENSLNCVDITDDGLNAITGDTQSKVRYWDLINYRQEILFEGHTGQVHTVKIMKNKRFAASGGTDPNIYVWDILNKGLYTVLSGHKYYIWKISFTCDDSYMVSGDLYDGIKVWNIEEKRMVFSFKRLEEAKEWLCLNRNIQVEFMKFIFSLIVRV